MAQEMTFGESLVSALEEAMEQDQRVVLIGGGLVSSGPGQARFARLRQKHSSRIKSPPIAELGFCGDSCGSGDGRPPASGRYRHGDVFLRSDSTDRQRGGHRLLKLRRPNQRPGDLFHALWDSRRRRRATFREPAAVVLEHAGAADSDAVQPSGRQWIVAHGSLKKPEPDDLLRTRETHGSAWPGS